MKEPSNSPPWTTSSVISWREARRGRRLERIRKATVASAALRAPTETRPLRSNVAPNSSEGFSSLFAPDRGEGAGRKRHRTTRTRSASTSLEASSSPAPERRVIAHKRLYFWIQAESYPPLRIIARKNVGARARSDHRSPLWCAVPGPPKGAGSTLSRPSSTPMRATLSDRFARPDPRRSRSRRRIVKPRKTQREKETLTQPDLRDCADGLIRKAHRPF